MESEATFEAPFTAQLVAQENNQRRKLLLTFPAAFQRMEISAQATAMGAYMVELQQQARAAEDGSREQEGILIVLQIAEQMFPHIQAGEIDLSQTIEVEMEPAEPEPTVLGQPLWHELNS